MKAVLKEIKYGYGKDKEGKNVRKVRFYCEVEGYDKQLSGSYSEKFARDYFGYCGVVTKDLVGKEVDCIVSKFKDEKGEDRPYIRFLNVLDKDGKPIVMPKELDF